MKARAFIFAFVMMLVVMPVSEARRGQNRYTYRVEDQLTLMEISIQLYGTARYWKQIARANRIRDPRKLRLGQKLKLPRKPTVSTEKGNAKLVRMWRKRFGLPMERFIASYGTPTMRKKARRQVAEYEEVLTTHEVKAGTCQCGPSGSNRTLEQLQNTFYSTAEEAISFGNLQYARKNYPSARIAYHKARQYNPESIEAWMLEISALRAMKDKTGEDRVTREFLTLKPELSVLPFFTGEEVTSEQNDSED